MVEKTQQTTEEIPEVYSEIKSQTLLASSIAVNCLVSSAACLPLSLAGLKTNLLNWSFKTLDPKTWLIRRVQYVSPIKKTTTLEPKCISRFFRIVQPGTSLRSARSKARSSAWSINLPGGSCADGSGIPGRPHYK